jgi:hypothetical protein
MHHDPNALLLIALLRADEPRLAAARHRPTRELKRLRSHGEAPGERPSPRSPGAPNYTRPAPASPTDWRSPDDQRATRPPPPRLGRPAATRPAKRTASSTRSSQRRPRPPPPRSQPRSRQPGGRTSAPRWPPPSSWPATVLDSRPTPSRSPSDSGLPGPQRVHQRVHRSPPCGPITQRSARRRVPLAS